MSAGLMPGGSHRIVQADFPGGYTLRRAFPGETGAFKVSARWRGEFIVGQILFVVATVGGFVISESFFPMCTGVGYIFEKSRFICGPPVQTGT